MLLQVLGCVLKSSYASTSTTGAAAAAAKVTNAKGLRKDKAGMKRKLEVISSKVNRLRGLVNNGEDTYRQRVEEEMHPYFELFPSLDALLTETGVRIFKELNFIPAK